MAALEYYDGSSWVTLSNVSTTTLTGAVTGSGTGTISTVLNPTVTFQVATQNFNFTAASLDNVLKINSGSTPTGIQVASVALKFNNYGNNGFRLTQYTDATALSSLMLSQENGFGPSVPNNLLEFYYSTPDARYRGKFYNPVTIDPGFGGAIASLYIIEGPTNVTGQASCIRATSTLLSTKIELENTNSVLSKFYELTSDTFGYFRVVDRTTGYDRMRLTNLAAGVTTMILVGDQNIDNNIGVGAAAKATLEVRGGVHNVGFEDSCIRAIGGNAAKIELQSIATLGKLYEIRALSDGSLDIVDRTAGFQRLIIDTNGNITLTGNTTTASITSTNSTTNGTAKIRKLIGNANAPTVVLGAATGTSPSSTITGTELDGTFSVTTGIGATTGLIGTFTIAAMPSSTFSIMFLPANSTTAAAGLMIWAASTGTTTFTFNTVTTLLASTTYKWNYMIMG